MESRSCGQHRLMLGLLLFWSFSHIQVMHAQEAQPAKEESAAEKVRKTLDKSLEFDFTGNSLQEALNHLKEKTKIHFVLDMQAFNFQTADGVNGVGAGDQVHLKSERGVKVRTTLQRMLTPLNMTFVIIDDSVLITSEELGHYRQMRQRVSFDVKEQLLREALKDLARTTGLNLILDPRVAKQAQAPVTLQLDEATLETCVKLLAEMGNLKAVRMGNVLFVTSEERAEKIRKEEQQNENLGPGRPDVMIAPGLGGGVGAANFRFGPAVVGVPVLAPPGAEQAAPPAPTDK